MAQNTIFNPSEVIAACEAAKAAGLGLGAVFSIAKTARPGANGTKYSDLCCTVPGKSGRFMLRVVKEKHVGVIAPLDEAEVIRMNAESNQKFGSVKIRDRDPTINVQKYKVKVETDDAGRLTGELPGDDQISEYFKVNAFLDEFFYEELQKRIAENKIILQDARRKEYPDGAVVVSSTKICPVVQTSVSMQSKTNPGAELANPIVRTKMKFDKETGMPTKVQFYDFTKSHLDEQTRKRTFEPLTFNGSPVTANNVHKISTHSIVSGIVNFNAICFSNLGISIPGGFEVVIVEPPVAAQGVGVDDFFDDEGAAAAFGDEFAGAGGAAPAPAPAKVEDPTPESGSMGDDDLADVISDLGV